MTYVVLENCIKCKYMDCVEVCPVDCFYMGANILVINPDECITCGVCVPECPADAIVAGGDSRAAEWVEHNAAFSKIWPNLARKGKEPSDADEWNGRPGKIKLFDPKPGC